jgi:hypothetical protein
VTSGGRSDLPFWLAMIAVMAVIVVFDVLNVAHDRARVGSPVPLWEPAVWEVSSVAVILAMVPAIIWLTRRTLLRPKLTAMRLAAHLPAALAFSLVHVTAMGAIRWGAYRLFGDRYDPLGPLAEWPYELRKDLIVYAALVGLYWLWNRVQIVPVPAAAGEPAVLEVRDGARRHLIPLTDIRWLEAAGNYVEVHAGGKTVLHRAALSRMEQDLAAAGFVRIHRSRLVARAHVAEIETKPTGDFEVLLRDGTRLAGSRRYRAGLG